MAEKSKPKPKAAGGDKGKTCRCARTDCRNPVGVLGSLCDMCEAEGCPSRRD